MKKSLSLVLALCLVCSLLAGCAEQSSQPSSPASSDPPVQNSQEQPGTPAVEMKGDMIVGTHEVGTGGYTNVRSRLRAFPSSSPI